jgi:hypothetical protein
MVFQACFVHFVVVFVHFVSGRVRPSQYTKYNILINKKIIIFIPDERTKKIN